MNKKLIPCCIQETADNVISNTFWNPLSIKICIALISTYPISSQIAFFLSCWRIASRLSMDGILANIAECTDLGVHMLNNIQVRVMEDVLDHPALNGI